jgi:hypothetical protein
MARTNRQRRGGWRWAACAALTATCSISGVYAQSSPTPGAASRLRASDAKADALLQAGIARSATFRRLVETIDRSDLVVYVETRQLTLPGRLQFMSATPGGRYVRVSVRPMGIDNDLVPWLAHELWHAVEIAGAPEVRDRASLLRFYERIGGGFRAGGRMEMETVTAQKTQETVLHELRGRRRGE